MKKNTLLAICGILCGYSSDGFAVEPIVWGAGDQLPSGCYSWQCSGAFVEEWYPLASPTERNCADYTAECVIISSKTIGVVSCKNCNPGYELKMGNSNISACSDNSSGYDDAGGINSYDYTYCTKNCNSTTCVSSAWTAKGTGYQTRTYRYCSATGTSGTCNSSTQYQCATGYYGSSSNGISGCTQCPTWNGVYTDSAKTTLVRGTSNAGTTAITGCYIAAGTYYDASGTFNTTGSCSYSN